MENLFFTLILFVILGGFISWKYISNKEKRCIKESKTMGDTSWTPQLEEWTKIEPGLILGFFLFTSFCMVNVIDIANSGQRFLTILGTSFLGIIFFIIEWFYLYRIPIFAIVDDTLVIWKYFGWTSPKKYVLSELTRDAHYASMRTRFESDQILVIELYKEGNRIREIKTTAYKGTMNLIEMLQKIPYKPEY